MNSLQKKILIGSIAFVGTFLSVGTIIGQILKTKKYYVEIAGIKSCVKVVLLSDLHEYKLNRARKKIVHKIKSERPDLILLAGDINTHKNVYEYFGLLYDLKEICPVYYVCGKSDDRFGNYRSFIHELDVLGIKVLNDESQLISINENDFNLIGLGDIACENTLSKTKLVEALASKKHEVFLNSYQKNRNNLVLAHRPSYIYNLLNYENVIGFSGRDNSCFLSKTNLRLSCGAIFGNNSLMFISNGIGNKWYKRLYNPNEIVVVSIQGDLDE